MKFSLPAHLFYLPSNYPTNMKSSSILLPLLFSYFVAAQSDILPFTTTSNHSPTTTVTTSRISGSGVTVVIQNLTSTKLITTGNSTSTTTSTMPTAASHSSSSKSGVTGLIIGVSIAGVAILCIIAFSIWKFRKRSDSDKNSHPFPVEKTVRSTAIAPFSTGSRSKAQLMTTRDGDAVLSSSNSDGLQERSMMTGLLPERRQTQGQVQSLRREVEQLRVEMEAIRAGQQQDQPRMNEGPPPGYGES